VSSLPITYAWVPVVDDADAYILSGGPPAGIYEGFKTLHFLGLT
jgi:hypothetical protein